MSGEKRDEVEALCEKFGYGYVMQIAADLWREKDPVGALTIGPCAGLIRTPASVDYCEHVWSKSTMSTVCTHCGVHIDDIPKVPASERDGFERARAKHSEETRSVYSDHDFKAGWDAAVEHHHFGHCEKQRDDLEAENKCLRDLVQEVVDNEPCNWDSGPGQDWLNRASTALKGQS
jgi:hypothetical protein